MRGISAESTKPRSLPTLPSLPWPFTSHLLMLKDPVILWCCQSPCALQEGGKWPSHQGPTLPTGLSSCKPVSSLSLCLSCSLTWRLLPLSLLAECLQTLKAPLAKPLLPLPSLISCSVSSLVSRHVLWSERHVPCPASPADTEPRGKLWGQ